jgi:hypothetical protein
MLIQVQRHEVWQLGYRQRRYLEHVTDDDLSERMRDIVCNLTVLTGNGKVGLLAPEDAGAYWMELFSHVLEEYKLRGKNIPAGAMRGASLPRPTWPQIPWAATLLRDAHFDPKHHMVKYGEAKYLRFGTAGRWRIRSASEFDRAQLAPARRDCELRRTVYGLQNEVEITILDRQTGQPIEKTRPIGNMAATQESATDYYVMCLSRSLSLRLFDDFGADSCVIIRDIHEFARRIFLSVGNLVPRWLGSLQDVTYYDPLNPPRDRDLFFSKHFRYAYQREIRFAWTPPSPEPDLKTQDFDAGPMADICDFLALTRE